MRLTSSLLLFCLIILSSDCESFQNDLKCRSRDWIKSMSIEKSRCRHGSSVLIESYSFPVLTEEDDTVTINRALHRHATCLFCVSFNAVHVWSL
jgi:hypothetical protein